MPDKEMVEHLRLKKIMDQYRELKALLGIVRGSAPCSPGEKRSEKDENVRPVKSRRINHW